MLPRVKAPSLVSSMQVEAPTVATRTYLDGAIDIYLEELENLRIASERTCSAFTVLQREVSREPDPFARQRALDTVTVASSSTLGYAHDSTRLQFRHFGGGDPVEVKIEPFLPDGLGEQPWSQHTHYDFDLDVQYTIDPNAKGQRSLSYGDAAFTRGTFCRKLYGLTDPEFKGSFSFYKTLLSRCVAHVGSEVVEANDDVVVIAPIGVLEAPVVADEAGLAIEARGDADTARLTHLRAVRDDLQAYLGVNLRELAKLLGVAYPTLSNLGKRKPHPSTSRAVLQVYAVATHVIRARGNDAGRGWLATVGREALEESFEHFKRASIGMPERHRSLSGISIDEEPELLPSPHPAPIQVEGERF